MKLMTPELSEHFKRVGSQEHKEDPDVIAVYFNPMNSNTYWFATEYIRETRTLFGYVSLFNTPHENEYGYFSLDELERYKNEIGIGIERDKFFTKKPLSMVKKQKGIV